MAISARQRKKFWDIGSGKKLIVGCGMASDFDELARTSNTARKLSLLQDVLRRATRSRQNT